MAKKNREKIKLLSSSGTKHFYTTTKNKKIKKKINLRKFDPIQKKYVLYKEQKLK